MLHLAKIKKISPFLALHLLDAVEDVSCLSSLLKRKCIAEYKAEWVWIHWDTNLDPTEPVFASIFNLSTNLKL